MKERPLLSILIEQFPDDSKESLYARVVCGEVFVGGERVRDPKRRIPPEGIISFARTERKYVSRAGEKLEKALAAWRVPVSDRVFVDAGASTGGFTDCLLSFGAACVHAVDVGRNQLDFRLRSDARVVAREKTNIFALAPGSLVPGADAAVADLSFRSLTHAARHVLTLTGEGWMIALVKPQFEVGDGAEGFDGVIRDDSEVSRIVEAVVRNLADDGVECLDMISSPIRGRRGNREVLALMVASGAGPIEWLPAETTREPLAARIDLAARGLR